MNNRIPSFEDVHRAATERVASVPQNQLADAGILRPLDKYYLIGTYPPLKAMESALDTGFLADATEACSVYVHIPFCEQRCTFCHFAKEILPAEQRVTNYLSRLHRDLETTGGRAGNPRAQTLYFGGGTPSYLSPSQIADVFASVRRAVRVTADTETTFELHPSVIDAPDYEDRLDALVHAGVNRWVFGIQSMDDAILSKLNRGHTAADVHRLLGLLDGRGLSNLSVDLIFGLPYQNMRNWYDTLRELVEAGVEKFNIFPLMFKQADPISAHYRREPEIFPDNEQRLLMHHATEYLLGELGFRRGPLFYYSKAAQHSRQQENKYDSSEDINLLPFGVSGFGYVGETQYYNECTLDRYMEAVDEGRPPVWRKWTLEPEEKMRRSLMFGLRSSGIDRAGFADRYGSDPAEHFRHELASYVDLGLIDVTASGIHVTEQGAPFADSVAIALVSDAVRARIREANTTIVDVKRDPVDRFDFSPIERTAVGEGVATPVAVGSR